MGKQVTEMLKGTLEGIVLAILAGRPAYGYEITAWLREQGFSDIAEGTVYALLIRIEQRGLVDVEKVPSEKGPPRKVYSLNAQGRDYLDEFWRTWSFLAERLEQLREGGRADMAAKWIELVTGSLEQKKQYRQYKARIEALPEPYGAAAKALHRYFMYNGGPSPTATPPLTMMGDFVDLWERAAADGTPVRAIVGDDPVEFAEAFVQAYAGKRWIDKERARLTKAIEDAERAAGGRLMTTDRPPIRRSTCRAWRSRSRTLHVLRGVDFDVARGSIFALLGSNGAGKTTVVKILSTLLKADAGHGHRRRLRRRHAAGETCGSRSASPGSSPRSTRSSPAARTWSWWPGCGTWRTPAGSPTTCSPASSSPTRRTGGWRRTPAACAAASTSR